LSMKALTPVRLLKNAFFEQVAAAEKKGVSTEELKELLGRGRAKRGMLEGDLEEGELEIGQVSALLKEILPASEIVKNIWMEFNEGLRNPLKRI
jgi:enoyl-[acyl-carrier protein] reductase II